MNLENLLSEKRLLDITYSNIVRGFGGSSELGEMIHVLLAPNLEQINTSIRQFTEAVTRDAL